MKLLMTPPPKKKEIKLKKMIAIAKSKILK